LLQSLLNVALEQRFPTWGTCTPRGRAGPSRCGAQCKTWARVSMQDLCAGPLWAVILWRHRVQSTVLRSW